MSNNLNAQADTWQAALQCIAVHFLADNSAGSICILPCVLLLSCLVAPNKKVEYLAIYQDARTAIKYQQQIFKRATTAKHMHTTNIKISAISLSFSGLFSFLIEITQVINYIYIDGQIYPVHFTNLYLAIHLSLPFSSFLIYL